MAAGDGGDASALSDDAFRALCERFRCEGFRVLPQQVANGLTILRLARAQGADPARLADLLTPVLATSAAEQAYLHHRLRHWRDSAKVQKEEEPEEAPPARPRITRRGRVWPVIAAAGAVFASILLGVYLLYMANAEPSVLVEPVKPLIPPPIPDGDAGKAAPPGEATGTMPIYGVVRWALILAPLMALGTWIALRWNWRRQWRWRDRTEGEFDLLDLGHRTAEAALFATPDFADIAQQWRRFRREPTGTLDGEATVAATVEQAGLYTPVHVQRPVFPSYVVAIEEESRHDHLARLTDAALDRLVAEGVPIERYYYAGGLTHLRSGNNPDLITSLTELAAEAPHRSLVVIGNGADLFEPLSNQLAPCTLEAFQAWPQKAFLSLRPIGTWGDRELALLDAGLALGTASQAGLRALGEHIAASHPDQDRLLQGVLVDPGGLEDERPPPIPASPPA